MESVIFIYANPQTFSKFSFSQSLAETSIEEKYGPEVSKKKFQALFTNDSYYGWQWMGQQWERSLFCQFQLLGSYWKVHWLKLAPGLKKVQWGKPTPPNIFFRPILPNFEKKLKSETMILGGGPCSQSVRRAAMEFREKPNFFTLRPPARKRREISGWVPRVKWCSHIGQQMPCWQTVAAGSFWPCFACPKLGDAGKTRVASKNRAVLRKASRPQFWF